MPLAGVIEGTGQTDLAILDIAAAFGNRLYFGNRGGGSVSPFFYIGEKRLFPVKPLYLPGAEPEKNGKRQQNQRRSEPDPPFRRLHVGHVIHGQACLRLHCYGIAAQS